MAVAIEIGDWLPAPAHAPRPAFAIGDVHGRDDLFGPLLEAIERTVINDVLQEPLLVTLGDYIDRGPAGIAALMLPNRINIDTRAFDTGRLTAVQVDGRQLRFIQAIGDAVKSPWVKE
jgi:hypothetical protein